MSFTNFHFSRRLSSTVPTKPSTQDPQTNNGVQDHARNTFELIDIKPAAPSPYEPQTPSPLLTSAPDSPPYFPFARSLSSSSFSDLECTVKRIPAPLVPLPAKPSSIPSSVTHTKAIAMPRNTTTASSNIKSAPVTVTAMDTASLTPFSSHAASYVSYDGTVDWEPFYEEEVEDYDEDFDDMPPGFPYKDWRGFALLAWEYLKVLQGLLLGFMEQDCRWGGARHTI